jgi:hypothetical protein
LGQFAKDAVKIRGISANAAAREFNAPPDFFTRWAKELGIIPVLLEGTGQGSATILDREKAQESAETFHEGKRQGIRPSKLHRKMASRYGDQRETSVPAEPSPSVIYEKGIMPEMRPQAQGSAQPYEVVASLEEAAEKSGVPVGEIVTTKDIEAEYNINKKLVHEWTRRGPRGQPHLTPIPVRLRGERGGNPQRLFRREDVARKVADPPKPGPPRKHSPLPSPQ